MFKSLLISNCDPQTSQNFACKPARVLVPWHECPVDTPLWPCINSAHQYEKHLYLHFHFTWFCESFSVINSGLLMCAVLCSKCKVWRREGACMCAIVVLWLFVSLFVCSVCVIFICSLVCSIMGSSFNISLDCFMFFFGIMAMQNYVLCIKFAL